MVQLYLSAFYGRTLLAYLYSATRARNLAHLHSECELHLTLYTWRCRGHSVTPASLCRRSHLWGE